MDPAGAGNIEVVRRRNPKAGVSAICALVLACAIVPMASATQSSADASSAKSGNLEIEHKATENQLFEREEDHRNPFRLRQTFHSQKETARVRGQQKIDSERAQAIQEALIRQHYLSGEATGSWNDASEAAMRRFQADNGWQSKTVPDFASPHQTRPGPEQRSPSKSGERDDNSTGRSQSRDRSRRRPTARRRAKFSRPRKPCIELQ